MSKNPRLGSPWRSRLDLAGEQRALAIVQRHGLADILARILAGRGVGDRRGARLSRSDDQPADARSLDAGRHGQGRAPHRRCGAKGRAVAIFGDYDVDGACSAALLASFLDACGIARIVHIPDRIFEGYGPNIDAIRELAGAGANLLVTVDCGTTSHEVLSRPRRPSASTSSCSTITRRRKSCPKRSWSIPTARTTCRASARSAPPASCS